MNPKLHFQRFEFKYLITQEIEEEIRKRIAPYVKSDPFVEGSSDGMYEVFSLYYDNPSFYYYQQKMDGVQRRKKVRLRTYRNKGQFTPYAFFELKRKHDAVVLKDRFVMSQEDYQKLIENEDFYSTEAIRDQNRKNIIEEFEWEKHLRSISPKILIMYEREPYVGMYNENFRITFDKNIRAIENDNLFYNGNDAWDVSGKYIVMEVKFNGSLPFYVDQVIKEFDLQRVSFSKYCNGVDACGSLSVRDLPRSAGLIQAREMFLDRSMISENAFGL